MTKQPEPRHITLAYLMQKYHEQSMLERIAAVIGQNLYVESNIEIARRVLTAMREIDLQSENDVEINMLTHGRAVLPEHDEPMLEDAKNCWQAMIDAALEEQ